MAGRGGTARYLFILALILPVLAPGRVFPGGGAEADYYWRLGVGTYGTPSAGADEDTLLTYARFDWQMINFSGPGYRDYLNPAIDECLRLNPDQKYLVRLWAHFSGANFLSYLYDGEIRERVNRILSGQVRQVLDNISNPERVVAFTFLEELPGRWHPFWRGHDEKRVMAALAPYREAIEAELGRPPAYDEATMDWLWDKYAESLDGVHAAIRAEAGADRMILYWPRYDWFNVDQNRRIINEGEADGVFIYVLRPGRWEEHVALAEENRWPFFSQLSHNTGMKQASWEDCVELPHVKSRYNLGYFFYGGGNPRRPHPRDNPAVDPVNNVRGFSTQVHLRWFAADRNLGWDIFRRHAAFRPQIDFRPTGKNPGDTIDLFALVPNPVLEGHFPEEEDRKVSGVTAAIELPGWLALESGQATIALGELAPARHRAPAPGSFAVARWRLRLAGTPAAGENITVSVSGEHRRLGTLTGRVTAGGQEDSVIEAFTARPVLVSGQGWMEPGFTLEGDVRPAIVIRTGGSPVPEPSLADGEFTVSANLGRYSDNARFYRLRPGEPAGEAVNRLVYRGTLPRDTVLAIDGDRRALLAPIRPLLERRFASWDEPGPGSSGGYHLGTLGVNRIIPPGEKVVVEISGKRDGAVNSHLVLNFRCADTGANQGVGALTNRFSDDWRGGISTGIAPPFDNSILVSVARYRFPGSAEGTVWYGTVRVDFASEEAPAEDVSELLEGEMPVLRAGRINIITWFDEDTRQPEGSKAAVEFHPGGLPD